MALSKLIAQLAYSPHLSPLPHSAPPLNQLGVTTSLSQSCVAPVISKMLFNWTQTSRIVSPTYYLGELRPSYDTLQVKTTGQRIQRVNVRTPLSCTLHPPLRPEMCLLTLQSPLLSSR